MQNWFIMCVGSGGSGGSWQGCTQFPGVPPPATTQSSLSCHEDTSGGAVRFVFVCVCVCVCENVCAYVSEKAVLCTACMLHIKGVQS